MRPCFLLPFLPCLCMNEGVKGLLGTSFQRTLIPVMRADSKGHIKALLPIPSLCFREEFQHVHLRRTIAFGLMLLIFLCF
jgi:hypothetical protein